MRFDTAPRVALDKLTKCHGAYFGIHAKRSVKSLEKFPSGLLIRTPGILTIENHRNEPLLVAHRQITLFELLNKIGRRVLRIDLSVTEADGGAKLRIPKEDRNTVFRIIIACAPHFAEQFRPVGFISPAAGALQHALISRNPAN